MQVKGGEEELLHRLQVGPLKKSLTSGKAGSFGLGPMSKGLVDLEAAKRGLWGHPKNSGHPYTQPRGIAPQVHS